MEALIQCSCWVREGGLGQLPCQGGKLPQLGMDCGED